MNYSEQEAQGPRLLAENKQLREKLELARKVGERVGAWLSASLEDPSVCGEMKSDVMAWFEAMGALDTFNHHVPDTDQLPAIKWVKNTPKYHSAMFQDQSVFLVALKTGKTGGPYTWSFDTVKTNCDGEGMTLETPECGCAYSAWSWDDFEYFALIDGEMPTPVETEKACEHHFEMLRVGGSPVEPGSEEMVSVCKHCGEESGTGRAE